MFQAGIRVEAVEDARTAAIDINMLVLHDDKIALIGDWQWNLRVDPSRSQTVLVSVPFQALATGTTTIAVDLYHGLRWLKTLRMSMEITPDANDEPPSTAIEAADVTRNTRSTTILESS